MWVRDKGLNGLAVRIHKMLANQAGLEENSEVVISIESRSIVVRPQKHRYKLEDLLKGITPANRPKLADWGPPVGKEIW